MNESHIYTRSRHGTTRLGSGFASNSWDTRTSHAFHPQSLYQIQKQRISTYISISMNHNNTIKGWTSSATSQKQQYLQLSIFFNYFFYLNNNNNSLCWHKCSRASIIQKLIFRSVKNLNPYPHPLLFMYIHVYIHTCIRKTWSMVIINFARGFDLFNFKTSINILLTQMKILIAKTRKRNKDCGTWLL